MTFTPEEMTEDDSLSLADLRIEGPALVVRSGGGRSGETYAVESERLGIGRGPENEVFLDDVTVSRRHAVLVHRDDGYYIDDEESLNGTYVNRRRVESAKLEDGDEVQIGKYRLTFLESVPSTQSTHHRRRLAASTRPRRVCIPDKRPSSWPRRFSPSTREDRLKRLMPSSPESARRARERSHDRRGLPALQDGSRHLHLKIRYLGIGLLTPRRTRGGYRLFTEDDVDRLETIFRLQRDEFLPLRVIRQELAEPRRKTRARMGLGEPEEDLDFDALCERTGATPAFVRDLEDYGLLDPSADGGERRYPERDVEVVTACLQLARYGVEPRNLRPFKTGAEQEAAKLEQIVAPKLRSHNPTATGPASKTSRRSLALSRSSRSFCSGGLSAHSCGSA
jgi:pSer/pThr/pTyr-binding forkhead associated (FHA) protein/DNA-binding transcriptional MerR regulator